MKWRFNKERRQIRNTLRKWKRSKKIKTKGIVKKLILLNCSLILAPEKNPRGWEEPNQQIQKDNEKDLKKIKNDKEDLKRN